MASKHSSQTRSPAELRERAVRMAQDLIAQQNGQPYGVVTRVARELGIGSEAVRGRLKQAGSGAGRCVGTLQDGAALRRAVVAPVSLIPAWKAPRVKEHAEPEMLDALGIPLRCTDLDLEGANRVRVGRIKPLAAHFADEHRVAHLRHGSTLDPIRPTR